MNEVKSAKTPNTGPARLPKQTERLTDISRLLPDEDGEPAGLRGCEICLDAPGVRLAELELSASKMNGCRLAGADLFAACFTDLVFESCDLSNCVLRDSYFSRCEFINCRLTGADISGAVIKNAVFKGCAMSFAGLDGVKADGLTLTDCDLGGASIRSCELRRTTLGNCSLKNAVLFRTPLAGMDLSSCQLDGFSVSESLSELRGAKIGFLQAPVIAKMLGIDVEY